MSCRAVAKLAIFCVLSTAGALSASGEDWTHWRGSRRNDTSAESSQFNGKTWASRELWQQNVGDGSTSPLVAGGRLFALGNRGGKDTLYCLDAATGKSLWQVDYACPSYGRKSDGDKGLYRGTSSTPEFDKETGHLYTLSVDGDLHCWDTKDSGRKVWHLNLYDKFDPPMRPKVGRSGRRDYGYTTAPLMHGPWLLVEVGDDTGNVMAFDRRSGQHVWSSQNKDPAGHTGGLAPMNVEGVPCVAVLTHFHLLVVRLDKGHEGQTVAEFPWETDFANNNSTPAVQDNFVVFSSGYNHAQICKLEVSLRGAKKIWAKDYTSKVCSPVIYNGHVYWAWRSLHCIDFETGEAQWIGPGGLGDAGSCIVTKDGRLIVWCDEGTLLLAETADRSPDRSTVLARRDRIFRTDAWPHVALAEGRIYCKDRQGNLKCFALGGDAAALVRSGTTENPAPRPDPKPTPRVTPPVDLKAWPGTAGLVLAWKPESGEEHAVGYVAGKQTLWDARLSGDARYDRQHGLLLAGGACRIPAANDALLGALKPRGEITIEAVLKSDNTRQNGPTRIVSFSSTPYSRNFTLGQERDRFILRLRTPQTGENGQNPEVALCQVTPGKTQHLIVSYREGKLAVYLDGKQVLDSAQIRGDFSNWSPQNFLLGNEHDGQRDWSGSIERLAIFNRFVSVEEAQQRAKLIQTKLRK